MSREVVFERRVENFRYIMGDYLFRWQLEKMRELERQYGQPIGCLNVYYDNDLVLRFYTREHHADRTDPRPSCHPCG